MATLSTSLLLYLILDSLMILSSIVFLRYFIKKSADMTKSLYYSGLILFAVSAIFFFCGIVHHIIWTQYRIKEYYERSFIIYSLLYAIQFYYSFRNGLLLIFSRRFQQNSLNLLKLYTSGLNRKMECCISSKSA